MSMDERKNREAIIRGTIERNPRSGLRPAEVDKAVARGMAISDHQKGLNWGQISNAAIAAVKDEHQ